MLRLSRHIILPFALVAIMVLPGCTTTIKNFFSRLTGSFKPAPTTPIPPTTPPAEPIFPPIPAPLQPDEKPLQSAEAIDHEIIAIDARSLYEIMTTPNTQHPTIVDVRSYDDYADCRIKGAINITLKDLKFESQEWNRGDKIILYAANDTDVLARRAARRLVQDGFSKVFILENGLTAWRSHLFPVDGPCLHIDVPVTVVKE